jgi:oxygen-independent coproporphyrinogen-3 oxidase
LADAVLIWAEETLDKTFYSWQIQDPVHIYIHIPFCRRKCPYCDFPSFALDTLESGQGVDFYFDLLRKEMDRRLKENPDSPIETLYFGGGTPTAVDVSYLIDVLNFIKERRPLSPDAEITLEMNPGTLEETDLPRLREAGFNRLSIGLQTTNDKMLKTLGRIHTKADYEKTLDMARRSGFRNISTDLMLALPNQTMEDVKRDLDFLLALNLSHLSLYSLIIEPDTAFGKIYKEGESPLPDPATERAMDHLVRRTLKEAGYKHYEISNYAKAGFQSRHNLAYWEGKTYYGFGLGASSYVSAKRFTNAGDLKAYRDQILTSVLPPVEEYIVKEEAEKEFFIFRLRKMEGFSEAEYETLFAKAFPPDIKTILRSFVREGLLEQQADRYFYTELGLDFADRVARAFL